MAKVVDIRAARPKEPDAAAEAEAAFERACDTFIDSVDFALALRRAADDPAALVAILTERAPSKEEAEALVGALAPVARGRRRNLLAEAMAECVSGVKASLRAAGVRHRVHQKALAIVEDDYTNLVRILRKLYPDLKLRDWDSDLDGAINDTMRRARGKRSSPTSR